MILYAIKEVNSGLFITRHYTLNELGISTEIFKDEERAERAISTSDEFGMESHPIRNNLAWVYLENKYQKNRMDIDISYREFNEIKHRFDLTVVPVMIKELEEIDH